MTRKSIARTKTLAKLARINTICDAFDKAYAGGLEPSIKDFLLDDLDAVGRAQLFHELLQIAIEYAVESEDVLVERLLRDFPEYRQEVIRTFRHEEDEGSYSLRLPPTQPFSKLPFEFGRYQIKKRLGAGGMGSVFLARDTVLERDVAIKVPLISRDEHNDVRERFKREARTAAKVQHPHLCQVFDSGEIDGLLYISMALVEGRALSDYLVGGRRVSEKQAAKLVCKLCGALAEAHRLGVTHRDLKPANIMMDRHRQPIIVDFGLARPGALGDGTITRTDQCVGTPAYMSPEQIKGSSSSVGPASDIFALGAVLYELVAGRRPFDGSIGVIMSQILTTDPTPLTKFGASRRMDRICKRAMAKNPLDRFDSMSDFGNALANLLSKLNKQEGSSDKLVSKEQSLIHGEPDTEEANVDTVAIRVVETVIDTKEPSMISRRVASRKKNRSVLLLGWLGIAIGVLFVGAFAVHLNGLTSNKAAPVEEPPRRDKPLPKVEISPPVANRRSPSKPVAQEPSESKSIAPQQKDDLADISWNEAFELLPTEIDLPQTSGGEPKYTVAIGRVPRKGAVPWNLSIDGDTSAQASLVPGASSDIWAVSLKSKSVGTLGRESGELRLMLDRDAIPQFRNCRLEFRNDHLTHFVSLRKRKQTSPLRLDLTQNFTRAPLIADAPSEENLCICLLSATTDADEWKKRIERMGLIVAYRRLFGGYVSRYEVWWQDNNRAAAVRALARVVDDLIRVVPGNVERNMERFIDRNAFEQAGPVTVEFDGHAKIRLQLELVQDDGVLHLFGTCDYWQNGWKHLTTGGVNERTSKTLSGYFENAVKRDQAYDSIRSMQIQLRDLNRKLSDLERDIRSSPQNTILRHRYGQLVGKRTTLLSQINKVNKIYSSLGKALSRQLAALKEYFHMTLVGAGFHEITEFNYTVKSGSRELCGSMKTDG